ncbi:MAG: PaaX family transcriptional regulator [Acidimicrobiia bacterium]|nr:PaaX family transcriptional regulator [Acidimicrobiia bacterium]
MANVQQYVTGSTPAALASVFGANRDGTASADSSRGLLITVMGEHVLPAGGAAWTQTLITIMEMFGVQAKATRQALARMEKQDWLKRDRVGRRTRWMLTDPFAELLEEGAERIYGFAADQRIWDRRWLVVSVSVPEGDRNIRYRMSLGLNWAGFGSLGHGLWINPWLEREPDVVDVLQRLGVDGVTFRAELGQLGSGRELAERAWDLPNLHRRYVDFLEVAQQLDEAQAEAGPVAARLVALVHRWRRFPFLDPDLPDELLPADWPGPEAARRFAQLRAAWRPDARTWWAELDADFGT